MKTEQPSIVTSIKASTDLSKNLFVGFNGNLPAANSKPLGVVNTDTSADNMCPVTVSGIALVKSGSAIPRGSAITTNALGKAVPASNLSASVPQGTINVLSTSSFPYMQLTGGVLPQAVAGYALDSASGADQLIRVLLT